MSDTIAAIATGAGKAGIGIVRISGSMVPAIAGAISGQQLPVRHASYIPFLDNNGNTLDMGIAILYEAPHSFTGEAVLELQGHGGSVVLSMLLRRVLELGARMARPGEFSERAFYNNKMDLAQAEAISDLINSSSESAARAAVRSMSGDFSLHVNRICHELIAIRVWLEAALDFSEEDIDFLAEPELQQRAVGLVGEFDLILSRAEQGQRLRDGLSIAIAGVSNAGKSSLLNRLSGQETAIVTEIAGTTRDALHTDITLEGLPLHIIDTAGFRDTDDKVEQIGIARALGEVRQADHVVVLIDALNPEVPDELDLQEIATTKVINKCDCVSGEECELLMARYDAAFAISVLTGEGMDAFLSHLLSIAGHDATVEGVYSARSRHIDSLRRARAATIDALARLRENQFPELAAEEFRLAQQSLESITGRFDSEDLLGEIFSSFCIGK
ncbi:MAG: tRNA uridine-5-carboxymethylaminomethyl(34) synthesis GTPase MnmE [Granulosicoccus sp.]